MTGLWQLIVGRPLLALAVVVVLLVLVGWLLYRLIRRSETRGAITPADLELFGEMPTELIAFTSEPLDDEVRRSFAHAESSLRRALPGRRRRYARPWVLAVGPVAGGKTTLLSRSGMALPHGGPVPDSPGITWWAFEGGVVLDVAGRSCLESNACASNEEEWRSLLRKVRDSRRRRPVDALLLTLPVTELMPAGPSGDQHLARAASRAAYLHRKLDEAQRLLRMRLPVYLVISHCDRLPGFGALRESLAGDDRQQIVGWSNPRPPGARYTTDLVDSAIDGIAAQLEDHQLELLAAGEVAGGRGDLIQLPENLRALSEPLRIFANHLFLPKADGEEPLFRGIYFCGAAGALEEPETALVRPGATEPPAEATFVGDLLRKKVFPEAGLAVPTRRAERRARRRAVLVGLLLVALVAWGLVGLLVGQRRLERRLEPAVGVTDAGLSAFLERVAEAGDSPGPSREASRDLLRLASRVESFRVWSILLPASWFGGLQGEVDRSVGEALDRIIMPTLLAELDGRADSLLSEAVPALDPSTIAIEPIEEYHEFRELDSYARKLAKVERLTDRYQAFTEVGSDRRPLPDAAGSLSVEETDGESQAETRPRRRPSLTEFNALSAALLGEQLVPESRSAGRYLSRRLRDVDARPFDYAARRAEARRAIRDRSDQLFKALFVEHRLLQYLEAVASDLASLGPLEWSTGADPYTLRELDRGLTKIQEALDDQDMAWVVADELAMPPRFEEIRRQVRYSRFLGTELGPRVSDEMRRRPQEMFRRLKEALEIFGTSYGGPMLVRRDEKLWLSDSADELKAALDLIVAQLFMQPQRGGELVAQAPPSTMLLWKRQPLQEALAVFESYAGFPDKQRQFLIERELDGLPPPLRQSVPQIASAAAGSNLIRLVSAAFSFTPLPAGLSLEEAVEVQVRNLQEVEPVHAGLLAALEAMGRGADSVRLGGILRHYQVGILDQIQRLLDQDPLYQPRFADWQGDGTPVVPGLVASVDDVGKYLDAQREVVDRLSSYARPVLAAYGPAGHTRLMKNATAKRWMQLVEDLDAYGRQEPGNPLARLEGFIGETLPALDLFSCFAPPASPQAAGGDAAGVGGAAVAGDDEMKRHRGCEPETQPPASTALPQGDYFLDRLTALGQALRERCVELADEVGFERYKSLAAEFNQLLAGRFPFGLATAPEGADPADVKRLLGDGFCRTRTLIRNLPDEGQRHPRPGGWRFGRHTAEAQEYMELMDKVLAFFSAYLPEDSELDVPTFDVEVEFRTLRSKERGANQIIRWELVIGEEQRVDLLASLKAARMPPEPEEDEAPVRWAHGMESVLRLAWARDSPFAPLVVEPSRRAAIEGHEVAFTYREPWSLLRLISELEVVAGELPRLKDEPRPEILGFEVRTASADAPHPVGLARLYLTVSLFDPGGDEPLVYPGFPLQAPAWWLQPATDRPAASP